jgi:hypothetical protein
MLGRIEAKRITVVVALASVPLATIAGQTGKVCSLMTIAEAAQILGRPKVAATKPVSFDDKQCFYGDGGFLVLELEDMDAAQQRAGLKSLVRQNKAEPVSGVGDEAVFWEIGDSLLMVRKGTQLVTVTLSRNWGGPPAQLRPTLMKVAKTALAKLR